jgi:putative phage-type endonuclease
MHQEIKIYTYEQRSPEWYEVREGKITASPIANILGSIGNAKTKEAIQNLAMKLAIESVHGMIEDNYINFDMQRGIDNEPSAFAMLEDHLGREFINVSKIGFVELSEHIGASPDGITDNNRNVEIKCPSPENYFKHILRGQIPDKYYAQMQHQMFCSNTEATYFVNYCVHRAKEYVNIEIVQRDDVMIELIKSRCEMVIESKLNYIDMLVSKTPIQIHDTNVVLHDEVAVPTYVPDVSKKDKIQKAYLDLVVNGHNLKWKQFIQLDCDSDGWFYINPGGKKLSNQIVFQCRKDLDKGIDDCYRPKTLRDI